MHPLHARILLSLKKLSGNRSKFADIDRYLLSGHPYMGVSVPDRRRLAKEWIKANPDTSDKDFLAVIDSLFHGESHEEKTLASIMLGYRPSARGAVSFKQMDAWLDLLVGWAEIDAFCSGTFENHEVLRRWDEWEKFIRKLAKDKNINRRRAALVFLVWPVNDEDNERALSLAFEVIEALKSERAIIITKAISWVLRSAVRHHKREVTAYIKANMDTLPKIAIREATRKILTGRK